MKDGEALVRIFEELSERFARQGQLRQRDHCLVLAADTALSAGQPDEAERLRQKLLHQNRHHLLRPYASMAEALQAPDIHAFITDLRRQWPAEHAVRLHQSEPEAAAPPAPLPSRETYERRPETPPPIVPPPPVVSSKPTVVAMPSMTQASSPYEPPPVWIAPSASPNPIPPWVRMACSQVSKAASAARYFAAFASAPHSSPRS
jgi:hypothetical protein